MYLGVYLQSRSHHRHCHAQGSTGHLSCCVLRSLPKRKACPVGVLEIVDVGVNLCSAFTCCTILLPLGGLTWNVFSTKTLSFSTFFDTASVSAFFARSTISFSPENDKRVCSALTLCLEDCREEAMPSCAPYIVVCESCMSHLPLKHV